jgi:hypothetical protein
MIKKILMGVGALAILYGVYTYAAGFNDINDARNVIKIKMANDWDVYSKFNCTITEKKQNVSFKTGTDITMDNVTVYLCPNGKQYSISDKQAIGLTKCMAGQCWQIAINDIPVK